MKRLLAFAPLLVLAALAVLMAVSALKRDPDIKPAALVGRPVPDIALPALNPSDPAPRPLSAVQAGTPRLINLFASWCAPCELEHPVLSALAAEGVVIVGVAYKDEPARTRAFLDRLGDPFAAVVVDRQGLAGVELGASGVPETYAVRADGIIAAKHVGALTPKDAARLGAALRAD